MTEPKVFLTGGDNVGWALDEDLHLVRRSIEDSVILTDLASCSIVHSVWWEELLGIDRDALQGKRVLCNMSGEPFRYMTTPKFRHAFPLVGRWMVRSGQAAEQMATLGMSTTLIPYIFDPSVFRPLSKNDPALQSATAEWSLPENAYLIGNFHRDTEGSDLSSPKLVKGPDIFLETVRLVRDQGYPVHVVLAGPRRHWLRRALAKAGIPCTFIGQEIEGDDISRNTLPRSALNLLYNALDLYLVCSRSEGGPHSIMEAAAARCKIISTRVGHSGEILSPGCIFRNPREAAALIADDIRNNSLSGTLDYNNSNALLYHTPEAVTPLIRDLYRDIENVPVFTGPPSPARTTLFGRWKNTGVRILRHGFTRPSLPVPSVGLWHKFHAPPWGGGNQFMLALRKYLQLRGVPVRENRFSGVDVHLLQAIGFDTDRFRRKKRSGDLRVIHRIDGPITLVRGAVEEKEKDDLCFDLNREFASATVLQSNWSLCKIRELGYDPVCPVIIHNSVDPCVFNTRGRKPFDRNRKIRLISSSWSDNRRKGGPVYKWIEEHLDWDRFEYTFVGRASEKFDRIHQVDAVPSERLAEILRCHDIYITASQSDPCSNALIEALACGLPALYLDDGGHPELVGQGGLAFGTHDEILSRLDILAENYATFQNLIRIPLMEDVVDRYLALITEIGTSR